MESPASEKGDQGSSPSEGELTKENLMAKCSNLLGIARKAKQARDAALADLTTIHKELQQTKELLKKTEQQYATSNEMLAVLTEQKLKLAMDIDDLKKEKARNLADIKTLVVDKENAETEAESYKRQYDRLFKDNEELVSELQRRTESENRLMDDVKKLHENNENVKLLCSSIGHEKQELQNNLTNMTEKINKYEEEKKRWWLSIEQKYGVRELPADDFIKFIDSQINTGSKLLQSEVGNSSVVLHHNLDELSSKLKELGENNDVLSSELQKCREQNAKLVNDLEVANADRDKTMMNLEDLRLETKQLIDNSDKLMEDIEKLKNEKDKIETHLSGVVGSKNVEIERLKETCDKLKELEKSANDCADCHVLSEKCSLQKDEIDKLKQEIAAFESLEFNKTFFIEFKDCIISKLTCTIEMNSEFRSKFDDCQTANDISEIIAELCQVSEVRFDSLQKEKNALNNQLAELKIQHSNTVMNEKELIVKNQRYVEEVEILKTQLSNKSEAHNKVYVELEKYESDLWKLNEAHHKLTVSNESLQSELTLKTQLCEELAQKIDQKDQEWTEDSNKVKRLQEELSFNSQELNKLTSELLKCRTQKEELDQLHVKLSNELKVCQSELLCKSKLCDELSMKMDSKIGMCNKHSNELEKLQIEIRNKHAKIEELISELKEHELISDKYNEEKLTKEKLLSDLEDKSKELDDLTDKYNKCSDEIESLLLQLEHKKEENSNLCSALDQVNMSCNELQCRLQTISSDQNKYEELNSQNSALTKELTEVKSALDTVTREKEDLDKTFNEQTHQISKYSEEIENLKAFIGKIEVENQDKISYLDKVVKEMSNNEVQLKNDVFELGKIKELNLKLEDELYRSQNEIKHLMSKLEETELVKSELIDKCSNTEKQVENAREKLTEANNRINELEHSLDNKESSIVELKRKFKSVETMSSNQLEQVESTRSELEDLAKENSSLKEKLSSECMKLARYVKTQDTEREELLSIAKGLQDELDRKSQEIQELNQVWASSLKSALTSLNDFRVNLVDLGKQCQTVQEVFMSGFSRVNDLIKENVESVIVFSIEDTKKQLLDEMHIMNEALRERGKALSNLQASMGEIQGKLDEELTLNEKLNQEVAQLKINEKNKDELLGVKQVQIKEMENEILKLRDSRDFKRDSDVLSTSTISHTEDHARLKEVEDSIEDKYVKLRHLAVKLKKRVSELSQTLDSERSRSLSERNEMQEKILILSGAAKNAQKLQDSYDKVLNDVEDLKRENSQLNSTLKDWKLSEDTLKNQIVSLESSNKNIPTMKKQIENLNGTIKELKNDLNKMEMEKKVEVMKYDELKKQNISLESKVQSLSQSLEQAVQHGRSSNLLELEMKNYEKVVADLTAQINTDKTKINNLEKEIESLGVVKKGLEEQLSMYEEQMKVEEERCKTLKEQLESSREKNDATNLMSEELRIEISELKNKFQASNNKNEQLMIELSSISAEFSAKELEMQNKIALLRSHVQSLESTLSTTKQDLGTSNSELEHLREEFDNYRRRAQSTLAKQKGDSVSFVEKEAKEEVEKLKEQLDTLRSKMESTQSEAEILSNKLTSLQLEKSRTEKRYEDLKKNYQQKITDLDSLNAEYRAYKLTSDNTLQNRKMEFEEKEREFKHDLATLQETIDDLKYKMDLRDLTESNDAIEASPDKQTYDVHNLQEREEGEGSEGVPLPTQTKGHNLIPLDVLLNNPIDDENRVPRLLDQLDNMQKDIYTYEVRTKHLVSLLNEAEKDAARSSHQNSVLKEELRRLERSLERQPHIANSEYLKNVVLKFITLQNGDERARLVPVLDTILKLSPEETSKLNLVARGESSAGWGSYLHSFTGL